MAWPLRHLPPLQHHPLSPLHERLQLLEKFLALVLRHRPHDEINDPLEFSISAFWVGLKQLLENRRKQFRLLLVCICLEKQRQLHFLERFGRHLPPRHRNLPHRFADPRNSTRSFAILSPLNAMQYSKRAGLASKFPVSTVSTTHSPSRSCQPRISV